MTKAKEILNLIKNTKEYVDFNFSKYWNELTASFKEGYNYEIPAEHKDRWTIYIAIMRKQAGWYYKIDETKQMICECYLQEIKNT